MVDWSGLANEKYSQSQQEIDNKRMVQEAEAARINTSTGLMGGTAASENALRAAQARRMGVEADLMPGQMQADQAKTYGSLDAMRAAQGLARDKFGMDMATDWAKQDIYGRSADLSNQATRQSMAMSMMPGGLDLARILGSRLYGFSDGTERVPGHGDGTVDTVPAMLAPGEAVLNKAAAEMLGRGMIEVLNKSGEAQMDAMQGNNGDVTKAAKGAVEGGKPIEKGSKPGEKVKAKDPQKMNSGGARPESRQGLACGTSKVQKHAKGTENVQPTGAPAPAAGGQDQDSMLGQLLRAIITIAAQQPEGGPPAPAEQTKAPI